MASQESREVVENWISAEATEVEGDSLGASAGAILPAKPSEEDHDSDGEVIAAENENVASQEDTSNSSTVFVCDSTLADPGQVTRDWISVDNRGSASQAASGCRTGVLEFPEWVSVEVPNPSSSSCTSPPPMVEWVTVDMPSQDKSSSTLDDEFLLRFSRMDDESIQKQEAAVPRPTRKRRTISGKIRARIEAFEKSFRQELDRLNAPQSKSKSRRIHESLRRGGIAALEDDKALDNQSDQTTLVEDKIIKADDTVLEAHSEVSQERQQVVEAGAGDQTPSMQQEQDKEGVEDKAEMPVTKEEKMHPATGTETDARKAEEEEEWELPKEAMELVSKFQATEEASKEFEEGVSGGIGVSGLMKQVISGAALLAGLIFLWPRGNTLIWRNPQKRQRYFVVKRGALEKKDSAPRKNSNHIHRMNFERFKG